MAKQETSAVKEFIAGCVAGFSKVFTGQPFDIVKVRLQGFQGQNKPSALSVAKNIIQNEGGPTALWKGSLPPLLGVGATVSIQFGASENIKKILIRNNGGKKLSFNEQCFAGFMAGFLNSFVSAPLEHFRIRIQTQSQTAPIYKGSMDCMATIFRSYGLTGVFRGFVPTALRDSFGYGIYFATYAWFMDLFAPGQARREQNVFKIGLAGALTGILFWSAIFPFDVIKTRFQTDSLTEPQYRSMKDGFSKVYQAKGLAGFYGGFFPCFLRAIPVNGIVFMMFELLHRQFIAPKPQLLKAAI